ncbi:hypothetical protein E2542_SST01434 [Spatholobus suberectus]|nr:hypothetical protein E2542_SST01434 [Spatholobus suberectus]
MVHPLHHSSIFSPFPSSLLPLSWYHSTDTQTSAEAITGDSTPASVGRRCRWTARQRDPERWPAQGTAAPPRCSIRRPSVAARIRAWNPHIWLL